VTLGSVFRWISAQHVSLAILLPVQVLFVG